MSYESLTQGEIDVLQQWALTQASGTSVVDPINADNMTLTGGTLGQTGKIGGTACSFNGTSDDLISTADIDYTGEHTLTYEFIFYPTYDETTPDGMLIESGDGSPLEFQGYIEWESTGLLKLVLNGTVGLNRAYYSKPSAAWHHMAIVFSMEENVQFYLDGAVQTPTSRPNTSINTGEFFINDELNLMSRHSASLWQPGTMQWCTMYSGHSASMILNHYNAAFSTPTITSVGGDDSITIGETGVAVVGTNYLLAQGDDGNVWLTNNATWGSETVGPVVQTVTDWTSTSIEITVVQGGLSTGTVYAYVEHDGEIVNTTGHSVTLASSGNAFTADGDLPSMDGSSTFEQSQEMSAAGSLPLMNGSATFANTADNAFTAAGTLPALESTASFSQSNNLSVDATLPAPIADADFSQANQMAAAGVLQFVEADATFEQSNQLAVAGVLPLLIGAAPFEQSNPMVASGEIPVPVAEATFENLGENSFTAAGSLPAMEGLATFAQVNDFLVSGNLPLVEGAATFGNTDVNSFTAAGALPALLGSGTFSQANEFGAAGGLPALVGSADFAQANNLTAAGVLSLLVGSATFENTARNPFTAAGSLPILDGAGLFEQANDLIAAGTLPLIVGGATFENPTPGVTIYVPVIVGTSVMGGAPTVTIPGLNDFQQLLYVDDLANTFFNNSEFAIQIQYYHSSLNVWKTYDVIFDDPTATAKVAEGEFNTLRPQFQISEAVLTHRVLKQDKCRVRGKLHYVDDHVSDGVGVTTAYLRLK